MNLHRAHAVPAGGDRIGSTVDLISSDDEIMDDRTLYLHEFISRKHAGDYPADLKRNVFMCFLRTLNPENLVSIDWRDSLVKAKNFYGGKKEMQGWKKWRVKDFAPILYDCGISLAKEYGQDGQSSPTTCTSYRITHGARTLLDMHIFYVMEVKKGKNHVFIMKENCRVKALKKASEKSSVKDIPQGFRYDEKMVSNNNYFVIVTYYYYF